MKPSEFYETWWRIKGKDGLYVMPPKLSDAEKEYLDKAAEGKCDFVEFFRTRRPRVRINVDRLMSDMKKLPPIFIPHNQPKLDKYGQIIEDERDPLQ